VDRYVTLAGRSEARIKVERSEFLGIALPAADLPSFLGELASAEKTYFDATHHCWAYRPFSGPERSSDAGEPHGSAGKPIAQAISGAALHNVGVVVVRWYGGVKLGTGGLSRAYGQAAADALRAGVREEHFLYERIEVEVPFARISDAYRLVAPPDVLLAGQDFGDRNVFSFDVRTSLAKGFRKEMVEKRLAILP
jgi:putative IMPACT (imprinted ancient) family translation regulator